MQYRLVGISLIQRQNESLNARGRSQVQICDAYALRHSSLLCISGGSASSLLSEMCIHRIRHPDRVILYFPIPASRLLLPNNRAHNFNKPVSTKRAELHHQVWIMQTLTCCLEAIFQVHFLNPTPNPTNDRASRGPISQTIGP